MSREDSFEAGKSQALSSEERMGVGMQVRGANLALFGSQGSCWRQTGLKGRDPTEAARLLCQCCLSPSPRGGYIFLNKQKN